VGAGFSNKFRKTDRVAVTFFGDGASNEGSFHEAANMAGLYQLPVIFVCENNGYGEYTAQANHQAIVDVADRAAGYGMPGVIVDGMDAVAVFEAAGIAIQRAREGQGPTLLECKTYRFYDHVGVRGMGLKYRSDDEVEEWKRRDPISLLETRLAEQDILSEPEARAVHEDVLADVEAAVEFAENSPLPEPSALLEDVYA
jgi:pyruvate dehydrogenase E1 component alpha subunit